MSRNFVAVLLFAVALSCQPKGDSGQKLGLGYEGHYPITFPDNYSGSNVMDMNQGCNTALDKNHTVQTWEDSAGVMHVQADAGVNFSGPVAASSATFSGSVTGTFQIGGINLGGPFDFVFSDAGAPTAAVVDPAATRFSYLLCGPIGSADGGTVQSQTFTETLLPDGGPSGVAGCDAGCPAWTLAGGGPIIGQVDCLKLN